MESLVYARKWRAFQQDPKRRYLSNKVAAVAEVWCIFDGGIGDRKTGRSKYIQQSRRVADLRGEVTT